MIKIENTMVTGWEPAIRGARNPMNSWEKSDSLFYDYYDDSIDEVVYHTISDEAKLQRMDAWGNDISWTELGLKIGPNDLKLLTNLADAGSDEAKFRRMIAVYVDITAPLYWWKEADTYKVGTVRNSCSTMHKIHAKEFTLDDFSHEHLIDEFHYTWDEAEESITDEYLDTYCLLDPGSSPGSNENPYSPYYNGESTPCDILSFTINMLNRARELYLKTKDKKYWWQMIQLLPSSYNQQATLMLNYEVLANIYHARRNHKLDEWREFCNWIETLPYAKELITGKQETVEDVLPAQMLSKMTFSKEKWDEIMAGTVGPIDNTPFQMRKDILEPVSIDNDRILMKHCEEKDGLIELRKGVSDISIGDALYAQVIIRYDDDHYIKGMAIYSDDIPAGFDMVVNYGPKDPVRAMTNKCAFSANDHRPIKQQFYDNDAKLSPINIIAMECDLVEDLGGE